MSISTGICRAGRAASSDATATTVRCRRPRQEYLLLEYADGRGRLHEQALERLQGRLIENFCRCGVRIGRHCRTVQSRLTPDKSRQALTDAAAQSEFMAVRLAADARARSIFPDADCRGARRELPRY